MMPITNFLSLSLSLCLIIAVSNSVRESSAFVVVTPTARRCNSLSQLYMAEEESSTTTPLEQTKPLKQNKCPNCDLCDGSGRIAGGIGAVIPWIPIKAYRPCPNFIDKGGIYERMGQGLDEIAFGADTSFQKK